MTKHEGSDADRIATTGSSHAPCIAVSLESAHTDPAASLPLEWIIVSRPRSGVARAHQPYAVDTFVTCGALLPVEELQRLYHVEEITACRRACARVADTLQTGRDHVWKRRAS